jgi:anti-sigma-K factor RskA
VVDLAALESLGGDPSKFAVSVEPKGGVPKPTGAIVLLGERL